MSDETWRIVLRYLRDSLDYAGAIGIGVVLAGGAVIVEQLQAGQPINWTPVLAVTLASLMTALRAAQLKPAGGLSKDEVAQLQAEIARLKRIAPVRADFEATRREGSRG